MLRRAILSATVLLAGGTAPAQDRQPIRASMSREIARLVTAEKCGSSANAAVGQGAASAGSDWSRVRDRERGEKIIVKKRDEEPGIRYVLFVDDVRLGVLNLTDPAIASIVTDMLRYTAEDHPEYFEKAEGGQTFQLGADVRLAPDGVFIGDSKVVDLGRIIENVPRDDVVEVSEFRKHLRPHVMRGLLIGPFVGAVVAMAAYGSGYAFGGAIFGVGYGALGGVIVGAIAPREPGVIYRRGI